MILSGLSSGAGSTWGLAGSTLGAAPLALALASVLAYAIAAWPQRAAAIAGEATTPSISRVQAPALVAGWMLHAVLLVLDISGWGRSEVGARLGFGPVLSLTLWLVVAVHIVESRFVPLPSVRRALAAGGAMAVVLAWAFPGDVRAMPSPWAPLHWVLGVASYGLFGAAVLHAWLLDGAERQLRRHTPPVHGPLGLPLLRLERLTFRFVEAGFVVLTLALVLGFVTASRWRWDHKTVFSLLGWGVFAALIGGRLLRGWRGRRATRWLYVGTVLLLLAYAGSRFVFEVVLGRNAA
ncbi:cytochrome c biogenesis protein CcsA [Aquincola sp. S2]|uniref:Cytochrome c biogenesis protein CcsA n=1 Tax=Pseudaquabacterium terrae TaxID=2732868 RepID=A0ABX2EBX9_9BURK|nr:cytochrome c biogenesis protein CcsA [Aquabacterium terrae]NRF66666.1 cytochrome c biogenesis protein CcsA [Aquabacterium terrae]